MDTIWWVLGFVGVLLQGPMIVASVQTGRHRLFSKVSVKFEQWLINRYDLFLGLFIVGSVSWIIGSAGSGDPRWLSIVIGALDGWLVGTFYSVRRDLQHYLNVRMANKAGEFWCDRCDEVHRIEDFHV